MPTALHELIERARTAHFPDARLGPSAIEIERDHNTVRLRGDVLDRETATGFVATLRQQAPTIEWHDELTPLIHGPQYGWALCQRAVADVRAEPNNRAECVTQALFGEPIEVLRTDTTWAFVRLSDGYLGWMHSEPLFVCDHAATLRYHRHITHLIHRPLAPCYLTPQAAPHTQRALLPFGVGVAVIDQLGAMQQIQWPDGTACWIAAADLIERAALPQADLRGLRMIEGWLPQLVGVPYLWGGKTTFGIDCSGLIQLIFAMIGVTLRRDADQQAAVGRTVPFDQLAFGDLLFFDTRSTDDEIRQHGPLGGITHVGMALNCTDFVHSSSRHGGVAWSSFDPHSPVYAPLYDQRCLGVRRIVES